MMGHVVDSYNDITSLGFEKLRNIYAGANLKIRPDGSLTDKAILKRTLGVLCKEAGLNPDKIIVWSALESGVEAHRAVISSEDSEDRQISVLAGALLDNIKQEILAGTNLGTPIIRHESSGAAEI